MELDYNLTWYQMMAWT